MARWLMAAALAMILARPCAAPAASTPTPADPAGAPAQPPRMAAAASVMSDLTLEAISAWSRGQDWPRAQSSYAGDQNLALPQSDLALVLARKTHAIPPVHAYIKWQLLSFQPDLGGQPPEYYRRLVNALPELASQPEPALRQPPSGTSISLSMDDQSLYMKDRIVLRPGSGAKPRLRVATQGSVLAVGGDNPRPDPRYLAALAQTAQSELERMRQVIAHANGPNIQLRDRLLELIPSEGGARLTAMATDLRQRILAGEPSWTDLVARMALEAADTGGHITIIDEWRLPLIGALRNLGQARRGVAQEIKADANGRITIERLEARVPEQVMRQIISDLRLEDAVK